MLAMADVITMVNPGRDLNLQVNSHSILICLKLREGLLKQSHKSDNPRRIYQRTDSTVIG